MNFINPLLASLQILKFNFATSDTRLSNVQLHPCQKEPIVPCEEIIKTEDLYKLQAITQQEIIKRQLLENMLLRHQQESVIQQMNSTQRTVPEDIDAPSKKIKKVNACGHGDKEHYAKGMCNNCYHRFGRNKKPWLCEHPKLYACMCVP